MEAESSASDHSKSVVNALDPCIGMSLFDVGQDTFFILSDGSGDGYEGLQF
jgi:hypothetical protein